MAKLTGKKVLMIIASQKFRDEEFQMPKELLQVQGAQITVASSTLNKITGMLGMSTQADILLNMAQAVDYDAVIFVGGTGAREYFDNPLAHKIAQDTAAQNKLLGAICIAPVILVNAGLLFGKKAAVFSSEVEKLKAGEAIVSGKTVECDGKIITAEGPAAAEEFGRAIVAALMEN